MVQKRYHSPMPSKKVQRSPREELLAMQRRIFRLNQKLIEDSISIREKGFDSYQKRYAKQVAKYQEVSSPEKLKEALLKADIIYVGDYHTNPQSQRGFLRLLKMLIEENASLVVALELIHKRLQKPVNEYLAGKIGLNSFLKKLGLKRRWYFDLWPSFQPIFDFAKYHDLKVYGVESAAHGKASLKQRDEACAKTLLKVIEQNPKNKVLIFIGDLHIAPEHLPRELNRLLKKKKIEKNTLTVFQNSEQIYWKLAEEGLESKVEIVKLGEDQFCVMNTPPIIWQQSYVNWLEHEDGEIDFADAKHSFLELTRHIAQFLEIELPAKYEDVEVYTSGDLSFLKRLEEDPQFTRQEIKTIKRQIMASESYYMQKGRIAYLGSIAIHHVAEEASHYIRHLCAGNEFPRDPVDAFYANAMHEALGFFGSKIMNHQRKCSHEKDFKALLLYLKNSGGQVPRERACEVEIARLVLELKKMEQQNRFISASRVLKQNMELFLGVTHALGYMLGDRLYYGMVAQKISKKEIVELFENKMKKPGETGQVYLDLVKRMSSVKLPKRV